MVGYSAKFSRIPFSVFPTGGNFPLSNQGIIINTLNHVLLNLAESGWDSPMRGLVKRKICTPRIHNMHASISMLTTLALVSYSYNVKTLWCVRDTMSNYNKGHH